MNARLLPLLYAASVAGCLAEDVDASDVDRSDATRVALEAAAERAIPPAEPAGAETSAPPGAAPTLACTSDAACAPDHFCAAGVCFADRANGEPCNASRMCAGRCVRVYYPYTNPFGSGSPLTVSQGSWVCAPCLGDEDCAAPEVCLPGGVCSAPRPDGAACQRDAHCEHLCEPDGVCASPAAPRSDGEGCKLPAHCASGVCQLGTCGACLDDEDCPVGTFCGSEGLCKPEEGQGVPCERSRQCAGSCVADLPPDVPTGGAASVCIACNDLVPCPDGTACNPDRVCRPPQPDGSPCSDDAQCQHLCDLAHGTCEAGLVGGSCLAAADCHSDEYCDPSTRACLARGDLGAPCASDEACLFGCKRDGVCGPSPRCETTADCPTGTYCDLGWTPNGRCLRVLHTSQLCPFLADNDDCCESGACTEADQLSGGMGDTQRRCTPKCAATEYLWRAVDYEPSFWSQSFLPQCLPRKRFGDACIRNQECASGDCRGPEGMAGTCR